MNKADRYYKKNLELIKSEGCLDVNPRPKYADGTPAHSKFITQVFETYDISKGEFPIPTLRNTAIKTGIKELLWIYQAQSNDLSVARDMGINWWDSWDVGDGTIGERYGATVKKYKLIDRLLHNLEHDPFSRRHIINLYQESSLAITEGLYPCAYETIWSVRNVDGDYYLDLTLNQRSNDYIMAGYINKIQYVALQMMVAGHLNYKVGKFCHFVQNLHVYDRHYDALDELLSRQPLQLQPRIELNVSKKFYAYNADDFTLIDTKVPRIKSDLEIAI